MAKRRTRKEKIQAKHRFTLSWSPDDDIFTKGPEISSKDSFVKGQLEKDKIPLKSKFSRDKIAEKTVQSPYLASARRNILRSLAIASFILCLEVVIYLVGK